MIYAVIESGGKQYKVAEKDEIYVEKLGLDVGSSVDFKVISLFKDGQVVLGSPYVGSASVKATVQKNGKGKKIVVFTYKPKKNCKRKKGHRQPFTKVQIDSIVG